MVKSSETRVVGIIMYAESQTIESKLKKQILRYDAKKTRQSDIVLSRLISHTGIVVLDVTEYRYLYV